MLDYPQLKALLAVDETGTFEGAARELNVTGSVANIVFIFSQSAYVMDPC